MALPVKALPRDTVDIDGTAVSVRGLSRAEALHITTFAEDPDAGENYILACGADITEAEAMEWRLVTDVATAGLLIDRIIELSGLTDKDGKVPQP